MWDKLAAFWNSLTERQRTFVMAAVIVFVLGILASYVFLGTDFAGFGDWLQGWRQ